MARTSIVHNPTWFSRWLHILGQHKYSVSTVILFTLWAVFFLGANAPHSFDPKLGLRRETFAAVQQNKDTNKHNDTKWQHFDLPRNFNNHLESVSQISKQIYPGYPHCQDHINWMLSHWNSTAANKEKYSKAGVDGSLRSILDYLNQHGLFCPTAGDANKTLIRGVNLGGWFVLEPWITPSLFEQFDPSLNVRDQWTFCQQLGKIECKRQLLEHWETWVTEKVVKKLADAGINHVRIPVGYWIMGDIRPGEPWVNGDLPVLQNAMRWFKKYGMHVVFDLHCGPGSQNGFDNSGRFGEIHWADPVTAPDGSTYYPNLDRSLTVLEGLVSVFSMHPFKGVVTYIELINEAFVTIDINIVKDFYMRGYEAVRNINPNIGIIIGDSFRFQAWNQFMYPPNYNHVYIDTHIYQVFDAYRLGLSEQGHLNETCQQNLPIVAIAPLSTIVGEWSLATTDCAQWLNGYETGARYDGSFPGSFFMSSCEGINDENSSYFTPEYIKFLRAFAELQMDAYESGSAQGWFFWNFKTENAPQWNYLLGLERGWIPTLSQRSLTCSKNLTDWQSV